MKILANTRLYFIVIIIICIIIFFFSSQNGEQSSQISNNIIIRKLGHFSIFATLGFFFTLFINSLTNLKLTRIKTIITSFIFVFLYACSDEIHQTFIPGRSGNFIDVLIDSVGGLFGSIFAMIVITIIIRVNNQK